MKVAYPGREGAHSAAACALLHPETEAQALPSFAILALAFPIALHNWAVQGWHRKITAGLYYGEIFIIGVNTIVAFAHLLSVNAGRAAPEWVLLYEPFSIFGLS